MGVMSSLGVQTRATRVVDAFDAAPAVGALALDGRMLDRPHYRRAQRVLVRADSIRHP